MQIVERDSEIPAMIDEDKLNSTCVNWNAYENSGDAYAQWDSGV